MKKSLKLIVVTGIIVLIIGGSYFLLSRGFFVSLQHTRQLNRLWEDGQYMEALEAGEAILKKAPLHHSALAFSGFSAYMIGRYHPDELEGIEYIVTALQYLRRLQSVDDTVYREERHYMLGKAYYVMGRLEESLRHLEVAFSEGLRVADIYEYLALLYEHFEEYEQAVLILNQAIEREPVQSYRIALARIHMLRDEYVNAEEIYSMLREDKEDRHAAREGSLGMARVYHAQGKEIAAVSLLEELIQEYPESDEAHALLGDLLSILGEEERARYEWREAVRLNPFNAGAINRLAE